MWQVETQAKSPIFVAQQIYLVTRVDFYVAWRLHYTTTVKQKRCYKMRLLTTGKLLQHVAPYHYIFIISQLWLTPHPRSTVGFTGHRNSWYQQRNLRWGCRWWDSNRGIASSSPITGILTVNFSAGTRSSVSSRTHCTSRMRSQLQLRNDKYITMQYTNWINSFPAIAFELFSSMARALGL